MDGLRKLLAFFAILMLVAALPAPAMAQAYGDRAVQQVSGYEQGGRQAMPSGGGQGGMPQSDKDLMATMEGRQDISMFTAAVKAAGYDQMLRQQGEGPYMVFAPTDMALQRDLGARSVNDLVSDMNTAKSLVDNCIVSNVSEPAEGSNTLTMTTLGGMRLTAEKSGRSIMVNGIKVIEPVMASNGILAVTDGVVGLQGGQMGTTQAALHGTRQATAPSGMPAGRYSNY